MKPIEAYKKARESGYTRKLEEIACKEPAYACYFAYYIPRANIEYCQKWACKDPKGAYYFALYVSGADLNYCLEACKGTEWYAKIQVLIMEEALG